MDIGRQSAVPRLSQTRGHSITVELDGGYIDRELLQMEMEEYGTVKDMMVGRNRVVVTFYDEDSAHRAWVRLGCFPTGIAFQSSVRRALSAPDGYRGRCLDVSGRSRVDRSRSRSQIRHVWCRRRAVSTSPTPRKKSEWLQPFRQLSEETPSSQEMGLRERSRSLQQLVGSFDDNTMFD